MNNFIARAFLFWRKCTESRHFKLSRMRMREHARTQRFLDELTKVSTDNQIEFELLLKELKDDKNYKLDNEQ